MMYRVIFYFFLLCSSLFVNANPTYFAHERFEKFGIQDGLSSSKVFDIKQDKDGYIWCATDEGFCRFDGIAFKNYRWAFENSLDFTNQQALKIYCDENRIYIGTNFGLLMYDIENLKEQRTSVRKQFILRSFNHKKKRGRFMDRNLWKWRILFRPGDRILQPPLLSSIRRSCSEPV